MKALELDQCRGVASGALQCCCCCCVCCCWCCDPGGTTDWWEERGVNWLKLPQPCYSVENIIWSSSKLDFISVSSTRSYWPSFKHSLIESDKTVWGWGCWDLCRFGLVLFERLTTKTRRVSTLWENLSESELWLTGCWLGCAWLAGLGWLGWAIPN